MNTNAIEKIRVAESDAEKKEKAAAEAAESAVEQAKADAKLIVEKAKADGELTVSEAVASATAQAEKFSAENIVKIQEDLKTLETGVEQKRKAAIKIVRDNLISN